MSDSSGNETSLCVTCGEYRPDRMFVTGDCTCLKCYDEGRSGFNYDLEDGEVVERAC